MRLTLCALFMLFSLSARAGENFKKMELLHVSQMLIIQVYNGDLCEDQIKACSGLLLRGVIGQNPKGQKINLGNILIVPNKGDDTEFLMKTWANAISSGLSGNDFIMPTKTGTPKQKYFVALDPLEYDEKTFPLEQLTHVKELGTLPTRLGNISAIFAGLLNTREGKMERMFFMLHVNTAY